MRTEIVAIARSQATHDARGRSVMTAATATNARKIPVCRSQAGFAAGTAGRRTANVDAMTKRRTAMARSLGARLENQDEPIGFSDMKCDEDTGRRAASWRSPASSDTITSRGMPITPQLIAEHNLSQEEYDRILQILGREPSFVELGIFSAMWSEHCSYKSSRIHLKEFPTSGPRVIQGPGENAGVVDIGDGLAVAFKMESHNHP